MEGSAYLAIRRFEAEQKIDNRVGRVGAGNASQKMDNRLAAAGIVQNRRNRVGQIMIDPARTGRLFARVLLHHRTPRLLREFACIVPLMIAAPREGNGTRTAGSRAAASSARMEPPARVTAAVESPRDAWQVIKEGAGRRPSDPVLRKRAVLPRPRSRPAWWMIRQPWSDFRMWNSALGVSRSIVAAPPLPPSMTSCRSTREYPSSAKERGIGPNWETRHADVRGGGNRLASRFKRDAHMFRLPSQPSRSATGNHVRFNQNQRNPKRQSRHAPSAPDA